MSKHRHPSCGDKGELKWKTKKTMVSRGSKVAVAVSRVDKKAGSKVAVADKKAGSKVVDSKVAVAGANLKRCR
jgi:hypothetical protein